MKKIIYFLLVTLFIAVIFSSCDDKSTATDIKLDKEELILAVGVEATLKASLIPLSASEKMIWSSSNSDVAVVESDDKAASFSKGTVTGKSVGTAIIKVVTKNGKHSATCTVTVINPEPEMILVEGGIFTMGCSDDECFDNELPQHQVTLSSFKIAKYEITQRQWEAVMGNKPSHTKGSDLPVETVSWNDVQNFITKLNNITGKNYRLPTEAEWEFAARGGKKSEGYKYSGSNEIDAVAWHDKNSGSATQPVGTKAPNELGIYDMSGNVFEWCSDLFADYTEAPQTNPTGAISGDRHITRGGSAIYPYKYACRVSFRVHALSGNSGRNIGFRLVHP